jgi:DNA-binding transcriptional ArsR family regulator
MTMPSLRRDPKLLGSRRRTEIFILLALLGESYPNELCRLLGAQKAAVLYILDGLEADGIVASRRLGRTRRLLLDPRFFAHRELKALLLKLAEAEPVLQRAATTKRARPRRKGKST